MRDVGSEETIRQIAQVVMVVMVVMVMVILVVMTRYHVPEWALAYSS